MAKHSRAYYWTDEQRAWVKNYVEELNEISEEYQSKRDELKEVRRKYVAKVLMASSRFRDYEQDLQTLAIKAINDRFFEKVEELDDNFFLNKIDVEPEFSSHNANL